MKCYKCNKKKFINLLCKYCNNSYCTSCIQPEIHLCIKMDECKNVKCKILKNKLEAEKCVKNKLIKICEE